MLKGSSAQKGGESLGYFIKGDMVPEFAEAAFAISHFLRAGQQVRENPVRLSHHQG